MYLCKYSKINPFNGTDVCENSRIPHVADDEIYYHVCKYNRIGRYYDEDGAQHLCPYAEFEENIPDNDNVNHPNHYCQGGIECIKAIEASMSPDGFQDYCKGNVMKYIWRWRDKAGVEDLKKARVYLNWLIESAEKENNNANDK